ncbi:hypothetical protein GIB67_024378 [Kingdonia uniflora]|uniref:RNase H type-1 domain-containing protein n=1 Tax=Kingdonia uniflora TaxID=39325 RepID=A0A7J7LFJ9_9MAGN|nr:hypothetical protein GIB67_024378 [Kingdonia uniflora]
MYVIWLSRNQLVFEQLNYTTKDILRRAQHLRYNLSHGSVSLPRQTPPGTPQLQEGYGPARLADPEEAEALAVIRGLEAAQRCSFARVLLLSDCQRLVRAFRDRSDDLSWGTLTLAPDLRALSDCFADFRFKYIDHRYSSSVPEKEFYQPTENTRDSYEALLSIVSLFTSSPPGVVSIVANEVLYALKSPIFPSLIDKRSEIEKLLTPTSEIPKNIFFQLIEIGNNIDDYSCDFYLSATNDGAALFVPKQSYYLPTSGDTWNYYNILLDIVKQHLGSQPNMDPNLVAHEILFILKNKWTLEGTKKFEIEKLLNQISEATFNRLLQIGKNIHDFKDYKDYMEGDNTTLVPPLFELNEPKFSVLRKKHMASVSKTRIPDFYSQCNMNLQRQQSVEEVKATTRVFQKRMNIFASDSDSDNMNLQRQRSDEEVKATTRVAKKKINIFASDSDSDHEDEDEHV